MAKAPENKGLLSLQAILKIAQDRHVKAGDYIFKEGQEDPACYLILRGEVSIVKGKEEKTIAHLHTGDLLGEGALSGPGKRPASAKAVTDLDLLVIPVERFETLMKEDPNLSIQFLLGALEAVNHRLRQSDIRVVALLEVSQLLEMHRDDLKNLGHAVLQKCMEILSSQGGEMLLRYPMEKEMRIVATAGENKGQELKVPLKNLGFLVLHRRADSRQYDEDDFRLLSLIADLADAVIESAFSQASEKARSLLSQKRFTH